MNILFRFLSSEAIENCITCLNYAFDKVVFFCYEEIRKEEKNNIGNFLKNNLGVDSLFVDIKEKSIESLRDMIVSRISKNNKNYFDMTGCEGLLQVTMTNVAYEYGIPMHIYDIRSDKAVNIDDNIKGSNINKVTKRKYQLNINKYIEMVGGLIIDNMHKDNKDCVDSIEYKKLSSIKKKYNDIWPYIAACMQACNVHKNNPLHIYTSNINAVLKNCHYKMTCAKLTTVLNDLLTNSLINNYRHNDKGFSFDFISEDIKSNICDSGSILEMEVYKYEKKISKDCKIGVHLDWDGIIKDNNGKDMEDNVCNEIDVLKLDKNVLTFISCKDTNKLSPMALYELETVANRFGGKYCKKLLVCRYAPTKVYTNRASLIGIKVKSLDELINTKDEA